MGFFADLIGPLLDMKKLSKLASMLEPEIENVVEGLEKKAEDVENKTK
ncbi:hypothetical protein [Paratractidigestivibacter sp.]|nr:hypothetical protein [Paratractidigestivibacter sp.]